MSKSVSQAAAAALLLLASCFSRHDAFGGLGNAQLIAAPAVVASDGVAASTITVRIQTAEGGPAANVSVMLQATQSPPAIIGQPAPTDANGVTTGTVRCSTPGTAVVSATASVGHQTIALAPTATVTFSAALNKPDATASTLVANPNYVAADGISHTVLTFTVRGASGQALAAQPVTFAVSGSLNLLGTTAGVTAADGTATATLASNLAETKQVTAMSGSVALTTPVVFSASAPSSVHSSIVVNPTSVLADGTSSSIVTVTVRDTQGNLVPNAAFSMSSTGSFNVFSPVSGHSNPNAVFTSALASTHAEAKTITATVGPATLSAAVTFIPGAANASASRYSYFPGPFVADGTDTATVTLTWQDAYSNPVPGLVITLTSTGSSNNFSPGSCTTDAAGQCSMSMTSTTAETKFAHISGGGLGGDVTWVFNAGPPVPANSSMTLSPNTIDTLSSQHGALTLTLYDAFNNLVSGQNVTFSSLGSSVVITPTGGSTTNGVLTADITSSVAQSSSIKAAFTGGPLSANVTFFTGAPSSAKSTLVVNPNGGIAANGIAAATATVTLLDILGYPLPNFSTFVGATDTSDPQFFTVKQTDANGRIVVPITSTFAGPKTISAHSGSIVLNANATFTGGTSTCSIGEFFGTPPLAFYFPSGPAMATPVLLNGDAYPDLVLSQLGATEVLVALGDGHGRFGSATSYATGSSSQFNDACRLNQDPYNDIVVVNVNDGTISVLLGNGDGTLANANTFTYTGSNLADASGTADIACADLTGDGNMDVVASSGADSSVAVFIGAGNGDLSIPVITSLATAPTSCVSADLNADGKADLVFTTSGGISTMLSLGDGNFQAPSSVTTASAPGYSAVGYVDADTKLDVAVGVGTTALVFLGDGSGGLVQKSTVSVGTSPSTVQIAHMDSGPTSDLLIACSNSNNFVYVALGVGDGTFNAAVPYPAGNGPTHAAVADLNQDSSLDLVVTDYYSDKVTILLGRGDGSLATYDAYPTVSSVCTIAAGDVNGDGAADFITGSLNANTISVHTNNGAGIFNAHVDIVTAGVTDTVKLVDTNYDGRLDIVASLAAGAGIEVLVNQGGATFGPPTIYPAGAGGCFGIADSDFNNDGLVDLVTNNLNDSNSSIIFGTPSGGFSAPFFIANGTRPYGVEAADVNLDGNQDLVMNYSGTPNMGVLFGAGNGNFGTVQPYTATSAASSFAAAVVDYNLDGYPDVISSDKTVSSSLPGTVTLYSGSATGALTLTGQLLLPSPAVQAILQDFNGDGLVDILAPLYDQSAIQLQFGLGNGSFAAANYYPTGVNPRLAAVADFNNDGQLDFAVANYGDSTVNVYLYRGCP